MDSRIAFQPLRPRAPSAPAMFTPQPDPSIFASLLSMAAKQSLEAAGSSPPGGGAPPSRTSGPAHAAHAASASWGYSAVTALALEPWHPPAHPRPSDDWTWHHHPPSSRAPTYPF